MSMSNVPSRFRFYLLPCVSRGCRGLAELLMALFYYKGFLRFVGTSRRTARPACPNYTYAWSGVLGGARTRFTTLWIPSRAPWRGGGLAGVCRVYAQALETHRNRCSCVLFLSPIVSSLGPPHAWSDFAARERHRIPPVYLPLPVLTAQVL